MANLRPDRDCKGKFERRCGSLIYGKETNQSLYLIDLQKRKKISFSDAENLLTNNIITRNTKYICKSCLEKAKKS